MDKQLHLEIVTPDRRVLSETVDYVGAPGYQGEFGILPNHVPFLSSLQVGSLYYKQGGKTHYVFVGGGFAEVNNNRVTILAEVAEKATEIDLAQAQKAKERAEQRLSQERDKIAYARVQAELQRAMARMRAREQGTSAGTV